MKADLETLTRKMLIKYPFFGSVIANSQIQENYEIKTAATDGEIICYNPTFMENLSEDEQIFILAHEVGHIAFEHILRSEGRDQKLWNIATDSVINAFLKQDGLPLIKGGVDIPDAINYDAEEMYDKLLNKKQTKQQGEDSKNQPQQQNGEQSQQGESEQNQNTQENTSVSGNSSDSNDDQKENQDVGHDTHSLWDKAIERKKQEENKSQNQSNEENESQQQNPENQKNDTEEKPQNESRKKKQYEIKRLTNLGEKKAFKQNRIERKKQLEELRQALAEKSHNTGYETNQEFRELGEIGTAKPLIDWRYLLKEAVKYDVDWSYKNSTIENGVVTPYLEEVPQPETEIVLDTSGSINETLLRNFLRECKNILQTSKVKVGCFDTKFYGFTEIRNEFDIDNMKFRGGGGTNFDVAVNAFSKRVENKIIFTDGWADMPQKPIDAIWIVFGGRKINPKGGKVIQIDDKQLNRLYSYQQDSLYKGRNR